MDDAVEAALSLRCAQARSTLHDLEQMAAGACDRARAQARYAREVRGGLRPQIDQMTNRWPGNHGLGPAGPGLAYQDVLDHVLDAVQGLFDGAGSIGLTVVDQLGEDSCRYRTAASVGNAERLDALGHELREGPCHEALELDMVADVHADDLASADDSRRWPRFAPSAVALGMRSAVSIAVPWSAFRVGMPAGGHALGAVTVYAPEPHAFPQPERYLRSLGCWAGSMVSGQEPAQLDHDGA